MKHCLVLAPLLLSSAAAFTAVNHQFQTFVQAAPTTAALKASNFDYHGTSDRIEEAYKAWCRVYNKTDQSRLEIFAYHFLLAEKFFGQTGAPIKLNEYADMTSAEYMALQDNGALPSVPQPTEVIVSETKASDYAAVPEPTAPANYGHSAASYLDALSSQTQASNTLSGAGMTSYLDTVASNQAALGGAGMTSYLDTVAGASPLSSDYGTSTPSAPAASVVPEPYVPPPPPAAAAAAPLTPAPAAASTGNYMDNLSAASSAPSGAGMTSYLDSVPTNGAIGGAGLTSYLDSVASSDYTPFEAPPAAAAPEPIVPPAPVAEPVPWGTIPKAQPAQPYVPAASNTAPASGGNYMDNLSSTSSTTQGSGVASYLDTVASNASSRQGGAGFTSYLDNMGDASDFATIATPPAPIVNPVPAAPEPVYVPPPPPATPEPVAAAVPEPVQEPIAPAAPIEPLIVPAKLPSYIPPAQSRNIPGAHWMDTVTPISSYAAREMNGNWTDTNYQAANERYKRRQAARNYQQAQAAASTVGQQYQQQPSYQEGQQQQQQQPSSQESIAPLAERVQRRQRRQQETFGGGFIIS
mmetsp:Transcript_5605/g.13189  ORF Transcript_5605/g.13189 Transcript_5605/m.13189 type:complete len:580 (-) Transcript_5605:255-1994(-)|eukprot:CAMPEP_0113623610 /NCGR_PEP_ID=MMETSP0017_2-20120614/12150_1 /TAXON_ID=2856 /ORGANISM="Cylindrotheca closterium" /LENGTH=579 /DNA_ID=CAMNT_0000533573 /DNA_START=141 /DNA_END=1880 /DNA_ORIENTATION=+ /assembly_acc=CAM_ASM_000147